MIYKNILKRTVRFFISGYFVLMICVFSHSVKAETSSCIFIAENAKICGKEYLIPHSNTTQNIQKHKAKAKDNVDSPANERIRNVEIKEAPIIIFPDLPFSPSSSTYLQCGNESAVVVSQQKFDKPLPASKTYLANIYTRIEKSNLSFLPEQKQKFSIAATQCGILTSFSPNSPSLV